MFVKGGPGVSGGKGCMGQQSEKRSLVKFRCVTTAAVTTRVSSYQPGGRDLFR